MSDSKRETKELHERPESSVEGTDERTQGSTAPKSRLNVAGRVNRAISISVGSSGEAHGASSTQDVRIRQDGDTSVEESTTTRTTF